MVRLHRQFLKPTHMKYLHEHSEGVFIINDDGTSGADKVYNPAHLWSFIRANVWREYHIKIGDRLVKATKFSQEDALHIFGIRPSAEAINQHFHDINKWR